MNSALTLEKAYSLIPGKHRLNLHAFYGEFGGKKVDRDEIAPEHFQNWISWAKKNGLGLDFNPTCFSHPKAADGFTLSHRDKGIRQFWIEHCIRCREIGAAMGQALGKACVTNVWIPDGMKDTPADRNAPRARLAESLDAVFKKPISPKLNLDAVEPKLFGIGSESYVVGSHEFYLGYAVSRKKAADARRRPLSSRPKASRTRFPACCNSAGDFAARQPGRALGQRPRGDFERRPAGHRARNRGERISEKRVHIGLDYFDASINRVAAWTIGTRNMLRALLIALLEPPAIRRRRRGAISPRASRCRKKPRRCPSARSGIITAKAKAFPSARIGWRRSSATKGTF
jgi:L-rhamnose isomerase